MPSSAKGETIADAALSTPFTPNGSHLNQIRARPYESYRYLNWSPDGTWLAFVATNHYLTMLPEEKYEIYRVRFDGLDSRRLTYNRIIEVAPIWSHDGQSIIFFNDHTIHFISADGDEISRTHNNSVSHFRSSPRGRRRIDWSSDGTRIIAKGYYDAILYGRNPNGSDMQVLTKAGMNTTALAWASNDEQILYYSNDVSFDFSKLVVFDIKDNVEQISLKMDLVVHALWSPDSRWIAIRGRALGLKEGVHIYLLNVETGDIQHKTTMSTGDFGSISWSPDSKWIAYTTNPRSGGNSRIFKMERDSASTQQLIEIDCRITEISWSPT